MKGVNTQGKEQEEKGPGVGRKKGEARVPGAGVKAEEVEGKGKVAGGRLTRSKRKRMGEVVEMGDVVRRGRSSKVVVEESESEAELVVVEEGKEGEEGEEEKEEKEVEEEEEEDATGEELPEKEGGEISEVFTAYRPQKLHLGRPHPGKIVETSVLARATPPDVWYVLHPGMQAAIDAGLLSSAQLESIVYASQQHEKTLVNGQEVGGFFIGDGGKAREGGREAVTDPRTDPGSFCHVPWLLWPTPSSSCSPSPVSAPTFAVARDVTFSQPAWGKAGPSRG